MTVAEVEALVEWGLTDYLAGEVVTAVEYLEQAHALAVRLGLAATSLEMLACERMLGIVLVEVGRFAEAREHLLRFCAVCPGERPANRFLAFATLALGDYREGFTRLFMPTLDHPRRTYAAPLWRGEDIANATILLYDGPCNDAIPSDYGDGFGDTIQFVRFAPLVAARAGTVVLQCHARLAPLLRRMMPLARVLPRDVDVPDADVRSPLIRLPHVFAVAPDQIPCTGRYLNSPGPRPLPGSGPRVGICWRGSSAHYGHLNRAIPLPLLLEVCTRHRIQLHNLQWDLSDDDREHLARAGVWHEPAWLDGFDETASTLDALDLVISVDTATAHLAGALGVRTLVLVRHACDWRWLGTSWYASATALRQHCEGDWSRVLAELNVSLARMFGP